MTSIVTSSNEIEKKIAKINPEFTKFAQNNQEFAKNNPEFAKNNPEFAQNNPEFAQSNPEFDQLYSINGMLGKGGFGQVYSGVRNRDLQPVAIKIIKKQTYCSKLVWPTDFDGKVVPLEVIF